MSPYVSGYVAAANWGWPRWCNPWPLPLFLTEHARWDAGYEDAVADRRAPRVQPKLEPEVVR